MKKINSYNKFINESKMKILKVETSTERLNREIAEKQDELKRLKGEETSGKRKEAVKDLSEYTVEEKVKAFDRLYNTAKSNLIEAEKNPGREFDTQYDWEDLMGLLARDHKKFWNYYNNLSS